MVITFTDVENNDMNFLLPLSVKTGDFMATANTFVMIFIWQYLVRPLGGVWNIYELLSAFVFASVAIVAVILITKAPDKEITDKFDSVAGKDIFHEISV